MINVASISTGLVKPYLAPMTITFPNNMKAGESFVIHNNSYIPIDMGSQEITHSVKWKDSRTIIVTNKEEV